MKDRVFFFAALEGIQENLQRPNLSDADRHAVPGERSDARRPTKR